MNFFLSFKKKICYNAVMERRKAKRVSFSLKAERISGDEKNSVFIEDISEHGIHIITSPSAAIRKYTTGGEIDLKLELSSGMKILLHCITRWAYHKLPPDGEVDSIGLEIVDPPVEYIKLIRAVSHPPA
jgi:hypothetical protein